MPDRPVLAVLGGSFNPPHVAHVLIPTYLLAQGLAARVLVAPCFEHPLGKASTRFETRLAWTRAAMAVHGFRVSVSDVERGLAEERGRPSYTLELLRAVAAAHPGHRVRLVVGSDIIQSGETDQWHRWPDIEAEFDPIVVPRAGHAPRGHAVLPEISSRQVRAWLDAPNTAEAHAGLASALPACVRAMLAGGAGTVHLVGHGNVATHAARWLSERGFEVRHVGARAVLAGTQVIEAEDGAGVWLLARDPDLPALAHALAASSLPRGLPVLHGAGALVAAQVLAPLAQAGHPVGTLHPICSLRAQQPNGALARAAFGIEGDAAARALAMRMIGGQPRLDLQHLDADGRAAYHAACSLAANHLAVILAAAASVLVGQGHPPETVDQALGVLLQSSLENLLALGVPGGITGPVARGDRVTTQRHIKALPADAAALYQLLSERLRALVESS